MTDLSTRVGDLELSSPILTASGTAGHGAELSAYVDLSLLGGVVVKSLAHFACAGNPPIRVHQTPSGMINSVGLQGDGVEAWLASELPDLQRVGASVIVSIWGRSVEDYAIAAAMLADAPDEVIAVEVNISCPNTDKGNELFAHSPAVTEAVLAATEVCGRPRWAKLSPNIGPGLADIADAAAQGGAAAVTLINTFFGLAIDPVTRKPRLGVATGEPGRAGGVSGPAIHPLAVKAVADVHRALPGLPIVAVGGVATVEDIIEFALVGASAVQVGTANFSDPRICGRLTTDLASWCAKQGISKFSDVIGKARF